MSRQGKTFVIGVGMTKFERPMSKQWDYPDMGREAGSTALADAGISYNSVQTVVASYCYGEPTCGQRAVYELGLTGIPVYNVNNNCSSGSSALLLARQLVLSGMDCTMALGFEKMERGLSQKYEDKISPVKRHMDHMVSLGADPGLIRPDLNAMTSDVVKLFAYAAQEYMKKYPALTFNDLARVALKNRVHGSQNERASLQRPTNLQNIKSRMLCYPIALGMSAPTGDGGAAAIVCSEKFVKEHNLQDKAVEILAQNMVTDLPSSFGKSYMDLSGFAMAQRAADMCYRDSGLTAKDIDVLEVHDCFSCNELFMYEALRLVPEGKALELFNTGKWVPTTEGGQVYKMGDRWVVNASGGLESKGHPIGATGLGQCAELVWQLRGEAGKRQVAGAKTALQHNYGIGGAAVVTMYQKHKPGIPNARL
ncbi:non-specific lipid-transfer protein isoform X2 [Lingula anatina]|uniref:Non-specific lipid-transfer protein isoform X1 n=1 Tax=Lingula anatina TaxID=7574 RepID=A0A1S3IES2_LINAN|nr:non-specific lipid-transfer protein isoform X1 [Lingula anatina]XP_013396644.1 non-specific lipid-transfer protein isoform X2 [Lingula anatina]|eukprot:XP_013396643.1 non-specific lipid-transfer protein isoform X1 [Lingula anatina]